MLQVQSPKIKPQSHQKKKKKKKIIQVNAMYGPGLHPRDIKDIIWATVKI
jgi:hypothetical protein